MPSIVKPLFRPETLRPKLAAFQPNAVAIAARGKLSGWLKLFANPAVDKMKETELLGDFIRDTFVEMLGYTGPAGGANTYSIRRESLVKVDGKFADAALGRFETSSALARVVVAVEGKGPTDPLDRPFKNRKKSAVDQALGYAVNFPSDWYLVTNLKEMRLYHKGHDQFTYERFSTKDIAEQDEAFRRFVFLLGAERVSPAVGTCHLDELLKASRESGMALTNELYAVYAKLRRACFERIRTANPDRPAELLLAATQKILDRILFIAFCEDRDLLPAESIRRAYQHADIYNPRPIWDNFKGLFTAVDKGNPVLKIDAYNGGLFAPDPFIDALIVPDEVCQAFDKLAAYEYGIPTDETAGAPVDVEILGHIFEQSISDLEELQRALSTPTTEAVKEEPSKRKKDGAFYTPAFVTRYIVSETLQPVLKAKFERLRQAHEAEAAARAKKVLVDPNAYDKDELTDPQVKALVKFWEAWQDELASVRIVDPSCGSGAFLIEAFDQLFSHYQQTIDRLTELRGRTLFDIDRQILSQNLFGVDLNGEAVEICRLSLWIKTAQAGKALTTLDRNIVNGNSVIAEPSVHPKALDWHKVFPEVFAAGGFDVVIGNPPYVRQEWIKEYKPYLEQHYKAFDGVADLYVYFYELGLNILKPNGRLGFIVTNKWMKAGYGEALRKLYGESAWVESIIDFGHNKEIFPDADVFPSILTLRKPSSEPPPPECRVCILPREQTRIDDLSRQIEAEGVGVLRERFTSAPWSLEPPGVAKLMEKIRRVGIPLKDFAGTGPIYGIKTGFNEAFLIDTPTKEKLIAADPKSEPLFKKYLRGQDIDRWQSEWGGLWMIAIKSSSNVTWTWSNSNAQAESVFQRTYPALHQFMKGYESELKARKNKVQHWWELSGNSTWELFEKPKIVYGEITWYASWALDSEFMFSNNTVYFIPNPDVWLLAVGNSPLLWWNSWRTAVHGKDEALRMIGSYVEQIPIAKPTDEIRGTVEKSVAELIRSTKRQQEGRREVLNWLKAEFGIDKPTLKLKELTSLSQTDFIAEVKKIRGKKTILSIAQHKELTQAHTENIAPLQRLAAEALQHERLISQNVNEAYGLTPDEIDLLWETAPPRMPINRPESEGKG